MAALYFCKGDTDGNMLRAMKQAMPELEIRSWPDQGNPADIDRAIVWLPPDDFFDDLDQLTHVYSVSAGVDHLLKHPGLSEDVTIVRLFDAGMSSKMANYVLYGSLHAQRRMTEFNIAQANKRWDRNIKVPDASSINVGILGAGALGQKVARQLSINDFGVCTWSRTAKPELTNHFVGNAELKTFLTRCNVLVCLLPLTEDTRGILNRDLFESLPDNAYIINPGRGPHLHVDDLLDALNSGKLSGAMLDVFDVEPLAETSPLWTHDRVTITPHVAADSTHQGSAEQIAQSMREIANGQKPLGLVDRLRGY